MPPKKHLVDLIKSVDDCWEAPLKNPGELDVKIDSVWEPLSELGASSLALDFLRPTQKYPIAVAIEMEGEGNS